MIRSSVASGNIAKIVKRLHAKKMLAIGKHSIYFLWKNTHTIELCAMEREKAINRYAT